MKIRIITSILLLASVSLFSQKQKFVNISTSGLFATQSDFGIGFGIAYEEQIFKHHGYEFGLNYRNKTADNILTINNNSWTASLRENYINLPISYKFYSNIVNLTTGISFDGFLGGDCLTKLPNVEFGRYDIDPKLYIGWNFKIGKEIDLTNKFVLEPEIQYNPIFNYSYSFYGATIKLKYKL